MNKPSADGCCAVLGGAPGDAAVVLETPWLPLRQAAMAAGSLYARPEMASASSKAVQVTGSLGSAPRCLCPVKLTSLFSLGICAWWWMVQHAMHMLFRNLLP